MNKLQKYPKYKDSGIEWIGEIPEHWEVRKVKYLFHIGRGRVISQEELEDNGIYPVYSSQTQNNGILGYIKTYDYDYPQITWTTDGANAGTVFLRKGKYNCTNVCGTLKPKKENTIIVFFTYSLQFSTKYNKRPDTNGYKIMNNEMSQIFVTFPPQEEQIQIAEYLDKKTEKIDKLISIKEKLIKRLTEQKQIIINNAVTKGLNPNVKMKDSGIEWIGEIPEYWEVRRLNSLGKFFKGGGISKDKIIKSGKKAILYGDIYTKYNIKTYDTFNFISDETTTNAVTIFKNDLLFTGSGELKEEIGKCIVYLGEDEAYAGGDIIIFRQKVAESLFLSYVLNSNFSNLQKSIMAKGEIIVHIYASKLKELIFTLPPKDEQIQIAKYLDKKTAQIDKAIKLQEEQIEKLKEYKTTLIDSVVTGKVKIAK